MLIKDVMIKEVITVSENDTVEKCANLLSTHEISSLPVVDEKGHVKGLITENDLIQHNSEVQVPAFLEILGGIIYLEDPNKYLEDVKKSMGHFVKTVMTEDITTVGPEDKTEDAASLLVSENIKRLPVIDEQGKLVGIVSRRDIMDYLFRDKQ